jgi:hypothetical protein
LPWISLTGETKTQMHTRAAKSMWNPSTIDTTMQREDKWGKTVSEITICIQATLSILTNKDCTKDILLTSASVCMPRWPNMLPRRAAKLPTVSETMEGIHCNLDKREEEQEIRE